MIAHNAAFDRNFIDYEYKLCGRPITGEARWIDTLKLAQARFPGMPNSLDALCKRFKVSLVERTLHGALIDARLLAEVYLELRGGKERVLDLSAAPVAGRDASGVIQAAAYGARPRPLAPRSTPDEQAAHIAFLAEVLKDRSLWDAYGVKLEEDAA
jgi:DNA polymerase-3 subunit epsilon